ncbi:MAG: tRNA lysidine(34) synthetase TilS [Clostridia bacterium]|nr:tRNA lysidine(34) synthetase TilS [Clostridia bacterium]
MKADIPKTLYGKTVAVAVSGGEDSMALLHFCADNQAKFRIKTVALNVEHGIRGESSQKDSAFVKDYCFTHGIPLLEYRVDSLKKSKTDKISVEQAARALRYECFFDAIENKKCDAIFTAHHAADNLESVLLNLFRGTGIKGLVGIKNYGDKIYRPLLKVGKEEIAAYVKQNGLPFVNDETNFCDDYTRNFLRLNVIPKLKEVFPEAEKSILRLSETAKAEDEFLDSAAVAALLQEGKAYSIKIDTPRVILARAIVIALKNLGITYDYEKIHVDDVCALTEKKSGKSVDLPRGVKAIREYDKIVLYKGASDENKKKSLHFRVGTHALNGRNVNIESCGKVEADQLKAGLYADLDKIPQDAEIRQRKNGDRFTKFGGGTKSLSDYLTDKKIPKKDRDGLLIVASGSEVLAIAGVAISDKIKVDKNTQNIIRII